MTFLKKAEVIISIFLFISIPSGRCEALLNWKIAITDDETSEERIFRPNDTKKKIELPVKHGKCAARLKPSEVINTKSIQSISLTCNDFSITVSCAEGLFFHTLHSFVMNKAGKTSTIQVFCENGV